LFPGIEFWEKQEGSKTYDREHKDQFDRTRELESIHIILSGGMIHHIPELGYPHIG
jgi:hypothetical protein